MSVLMRFERWTTCPLRLLRRFPHTLFDAGGYATADCHFEEGVRVGAEAVLAHTRVGRYSYIAAGSHLRHCTVGAFCSIGPWVRAGLGMHPSREYVSTHPAFFSPVPQSQISFVGTSLFEEHRPILLGNDVWVGANAVLIDGVTVGDGAIVGAGAVVTHDVAPYAIVGGVPAKLLRSRFTEEQASFLQELQWWTRDIDWLRRYAPYFRDVEQLRAALAGDSQS